MSTMPIASKPMTRPVMAPLNTSCDVTQVATIVMWSSAFAPEEDGSREVVASSEVFRRSDETHLSLLHEDGPVRDRKRDVERLFDDHDRHPARLQRLDGPQQLLDDDRCEPE